MKRWACKLSTVCISLYLTKLINRFHVLISVKLIFMYQIRTQPLRLNKTDLVLFEHLSGLKVLLKYMHLPVKKFPSPRIFRVKIKQSIKKSTVTVNSCWVMCFHSWWLKAPNRSREQVWNYINKLPIFVYQKWIL